MQATCLHKISMQRVSVHFCIPLQRGSAGHRRWTVRTKILLRVINLIYPFYVSEREWIRKPFSGTSNLEWAFSSPVYIHGRSSFARYFWPRIVIRSGAFDFILTPYPFSTLFSYADITGAVLCLIFPAVARSSSRFFALGSFAPRKRAGASSMSSLYGRYTAKEEERWNRRDIDPLSTP